MGTSPDKRPNPAWQDRVRDRVLSAFAVLVLLLMLAVGLQVACSALDINPLVRFQQELPVLGRAITLNSLLDLQWHLLAVIGLLPAWLVWLADRHIRVDFLYAGRSPRTRALIDLVGHAVFAAPFLLLCLPAAWDFPARAFRFGEGSANDGLNDLFLIKAVLPLGLAALCVVLIIDSVRLTVRIWRRR